MKLLISSLCLCALFYRPVLGQVPVGPIESFIRTNFIGHPVIHNKQTWIFDPDVGVRRRRQFYELHGDKADKLIERIGLGIDGRQDELLARQRARDAGHLGGLNYYLP